MTYDGDSHTAGGSCKGIGGGELAGLDLSGTAHTNAGDYPSDPWSFAQTTNYNAANGTVHDQIDRANPDCSSIAGYHVTYDGDSHTAGGSCKGIGGGELAGLDLSGTAHTNAGDYPSDPWSFAQTTNYNAANGTVHDQIDRANPDCSSIAGYHVTYDGDSHTAGGSCKGIGGGELAGLDLSGTAHTNAGDYPSDPWSFAQTTNYNAANGTVHDQIDRANPDCSSIAGYHVTYDGDSHTAGGSCKGIGGGELAGLDLSGTAHTNAGDYPSDPWSFAQTTNYNAANGTVHDQIDRANPDCSSIAGYHVTYDGDSHTAGGSCKGIGGGELAGTRPLGHRAYQCRRLPERPLVVRADDQLQRGQWHRARPDRPGQSRLQLDRRLPRDLRRRFNTAGGCLDKDLGSAAKRPDSTSRAPRIPMPATTRATPGRSRRRPTTTRPMAPCTTRSTGPIPTAARSPATT